MDKKNLKYLTPFKCCIIQNFPFIEEDFDAITNYQLFCKVVEYLNNTITAVNKDTEQVSKLTDAFNNLKDYVDNYFNNLDVQEEINNKLDEMARTGELDEIVGKYVTNGIQPQIDNINKEIKNIKNKEIIMIGDSYLAGQSLANPATENYGYLLMQKLGFTSNKFHIWAEGGSSFVTPGNQNHTWQTLLQSKLNSITPSNITDIF